MSESLQLLLEVLGEAKARQVVADIGTPKGLQDFNRLAAVALARRMLDERVERRAIAYRLAGRYNISLKSAYRRISDALETPLRML